MSSNALVGPSSGSSFAQQGAVDWVALSKSSLSFSVEVLSRFSKAGVELITVAIGQAIFASFEVPPDGQKRLSDAVAKLKAFASYGDILWFGFGIKHITRVLCETEQGATCVAICACLSVSYDIGFASQVLKASTDLTKAPGSLTPFLSQWAALMNVCAGAVADSQFPNLVEGFSRLIGGTSKGCTLQSLCAPTVAKTLAGAIQELSKVSNGTLRSVTFQGGVDCGWLAAVAQWLLSLRVEILDSTGNCLHSNFSREDHHFQVRIVQYSSITGNHEGTVTLGRSYFVSPGALFFGLPRQSYFDEVRFPSFYSYGRAKWDNILRQTFGVAIEELLQTKHAERFAAFLCSVFDDSHEKSNMEDLNPWGNSYLNGYYERRRAFMNFTSTQLPELAGVVTVAESHGYDFPSASYNKVLSHICPCVHCSPGRIFQKTQFCLHGVGATIFTYLWTLSWLDIEPSVQPSPSGLLMMYHTRVYGYDNPQSIRSQFWKNGLSTALFPLFTGTKCDETTTEGVSAIAHNGICIYYTGLQDPEASPSHILRLRVVLGQIEKGGALFRMIRDGHLAREGAKMYPFPSSAYEIDPRTHLMLVADETLDSKILEASIYIDSKPFALEVTHIFSQTPDLHKYTRTGCSLSREMFGICELRNKIMGHMGSYPCRQRQVRYELKMSDQTTKMWTTKCTEGASMLCKPLKTELHCCLPKQGEWVIADSFISRTNLTSWPPRHKGLLCGQYSLLYSILCYLEPTSRVTLINIGPCLLCSIYTEGHPTYSQRERISGPSSDYPGPMSVYFMIGEKPCIFELDGTIQTVGDIPVVSPSPFTPTAYQNMTKKELEKFLSQGGIKFRRASKKQALIQLLQEHHERLSTSGENGQGSQQQVRPDVEMSEEV